MFVGQEQRGVVCTPDRSQSPRRRWRLSSKHDLYFDLIYTSVMFHDCILHGVDTITIKSQTNCQNECWQSTFLQIPDVLSLSGSCCNFDVSLTFQFYFPCALVRWRHIWLGLGKTSTFCLKYLFLVATISAGHVLRSSSTHSGLSRVPTSQTWVSDLAAFSPVNPPPSPPFPDIKVRS